MAQIVVALVLVSLASLLWLANYILGAYLSEKRRVVGNAPGMTVPFAPLSLLGGSLPTSSWNPGLNWQWEWRNKIYQKYGAETISVIPVFVGRPALYSTSIEVLNHVVSTKGAFKKGDEDIAGAIEYGANLFSTNGAEWRRHRRIMGPAFSSSTYSLLWDETSSLYRDMVSEERWESRKENNISDVNDLVSRFSLVALSRCGFGNHLPWKSEESSSDAMASFGSALETVSKSFIVRLMIPKWMYLLPIEGIRKIDKAFRDLDEHIKVLLRQRKANVDSEERDILSLMVRASESEEDGLALSEDEITGNIFFVLFAGHETITNVLTATLCLLALYEDIQDEMHNLVAEVAPGDQPLLLSDASKLDKVLACFLEAGRLFPAGYVLMREATEDTVLPVYNHTDDFPVSQVAVTAGTRVAVDFVGLHNNPRHFPEPELYKPSRWYGVSEENMTHFSVGPRACIGRKFANTEAVCFLAHMLRDWKFKINLLPGETRPQWRERALRPKAQMALGVGKVPLVFERRYIP